MPVPRRRRNDPIPRAMAEIRRVAGELARNAARLEYPGHPGNPELGITGWEPHPRSAHQRWMDFYFGGESIVLYAQGWIDALELEQRHDWGYSAGQLKMLASKIAAGLRRRGRDQKD